MDKTPHHVLWYQLGHIPAVDGNKGGRVYIIPCRDCGYRLQIPPHTLNDDRLRKRIERMGWELGRLLPQHRCPDCVAKRRARRSAEADPAPPPAPVAQPEPRKTNFLIEAWEVSSAADRAEFADWFHSQPDHQPQQPPPPPPRPPTLQEVWDQTDWAEQLRFLDQERPYRPVSPQEYWQDLTREARAELIAFMAPHVQAHVRAIVDDLTRVDMVEVWQRQSRAQHERLLNWLEQATFLPRQTLLHHWQNASGKERDTVLATLRLQQPQPAPMQPDVAAAPAPPAAGVAPFYYPHTKLPPPAGTIRKTQFADKLRLNRSTISGYIRQGMPVRADGLLDLAVAETWVREHINGARAPTPPQTQEPLIDIELDDDAIHRLSQKLFGPRKD